MSCSNDSNEDMFDVYFHMKLSGKDLKLMSWKKLKNSYEELLNKYRHDQDIMHQQKEIIKLNEKRIRELNSVNQSYENCIESLNGENCELRKDINDLRERISSMEQEVTYKKSFLGDRWCTGWIEYWKKYIYENFESLPEKIKCLKNDVDEVSSYTIDLLIRRNKEIFPIQKYTDYYLYNYVKLYEEWEKEGNKEGLPEKSIRDKYGLNEDIYLETSVFKFHCGLVCLPKVITDSIKGKDIIDGGAFWGDSALVFQEYKPRSIHAFEPMTENYNELVELKNTNNFDILYTNRCGLGDHTENRILYYHDMHSGASVIDYKAMYSDRANSSHEEIALTTVDDYVSKYDLNVGVIKLDIEGNELEAIKGSTETIKKYKPILLISVYHLPKDLFEIKPLIESWDLGYKFMFRKLVFHDPLTEVSLIGYV